MMQFNSFKNLCRVADYLLETDGDTLTPAILWALGVPKERNFISEMKRDLEKAGIIHRETRGYTVGKEYQRFTLVTQLYQSREDYERPLEARIADHIEVFADVKVYLYLLVNHEATMSQIGAELEIPKATISRALKMLGSEGLVSRERGDGRCALFRSTGSFLNRADYFQIFRRAQKEYYCSMYEEDMGDDPTVDDLGETVVPVGGGVRVCLYGERDVPAAPPKSPSDCDKDTPIQLVAARYRNLVEEQEIRVKPTRQELDLFLAGFDKRISAEVVEKLRIINGYYDERLTPELFHLRFRWNYKSRQTKETTFIKKSTRMTHAEWNQMRNRAKYPPQPEDKFYYPYLRAHLGPNFKSFDIKAAVPRVNSAMNGINHSREVDLYLTLATQAAKFHPAWKPIVEDFHTYRKGIKHLFMLFFFTGNGLSKAKFACANDLEAQAKKIAVYEKLLPPGDAAIQLAKEELELHPDLRKLIGTTETAAAFSASITAALGKVYNREVFLVESLIEMDVLWHFISQGRCIVNNYDEFFFLDDITKDEVSQVIEERIRVRGEEFYTSKQLVEEAKKSKGKDAVLEQEGLRQAS